MTDIVERLRDDAAKWHANSHTGDLEREAADQIERLEAAVTAWQQVFEGIEAHLQDRINMGDPAEPKTYLSIIRSDVANINRDSDAIVKARWADAKRAADQIERLRATVVAADREIKASHADADRYRAEIVRLVTALRDLVERWATERGYDGAIQRARALLLEHDLRSPTTEAIRSALEEP